MVRVDSRLVRAEVVEDRGGRMKVASYLWNELTADEMRDILLNLPVGDGLFSLPDVHPGDTRRYIKIHVLTGVPVIDVEGSEIPTQVEYETVVFRRNQIIVVKK